MPNVKTGAKSPTLPDTFRLKITYRKVDDLKPYAGNARTHSDKQIAQIATSIEQFGFTNPVLIDDADGIVAGHGRVAAARKLGYDEVPVPSNCADAVSKERLSSATVSPNQIVRCFALFAVRISGSLS